MSGERGKRGGLGEHTRGVHTRDERTAPGAPSGRGRPRATGLGSDLAALYVLAREGSMTSPSELSSLLDISERRASEALQAISTESVIRAHDDEVLGPIVSLCSTGERGEVKRVDVPGYGRVRQLRLTPGQADTCSLALDWLGLPRTSRLRERLERAFYPMPEPVSHPVEPAESRDQAREPINAADATKARNLETCARAMARTSRTDEDSHSARGPVLSFGYHGTNDPMSRTRRTVALRLRTHEGELMLDAYDLDAHGERTFQVGLMAHPRLGDEPHVVPLGEGGGRDGRLVRLSCRGAVTEVVLGWEGVRVVSRGKGTTVAEIPYFRGDWLPRQLLSLGNLVTVEDDELLGEMRDIARSDLARARELRGEASR